VRFARLILWRQLRSRRTSTINKVHGVAPSFTGARAVVKKHMSEFKQPNPKNRVIAMLISLREEFKAQQPARSWYINDIISLVSRNLQNTHIHNVLVEEK
jgi:hypothetical protein